MKRRRFLQLLGATGAAAATDPLKLGAELSQLLAEKLDLDPSEIEWSESVSDYGYIVTYVARFRDRRFSVQYPHIDAKAEGAERHRRHARQALLDHIDWCIATTGTQDTERWPS